MKLLLKVQNCLDYLKVYIGGKLYKQIHENFSYDPVKLLRYYKGHHSNKSQLQ